MKLEFFRKVGLEPGDLMSINFRVSAVGHANHAHVFIEDPDWVIGSRHLWPGLSLAYHRGHESLAPLIVAATSGLFRFLDLRKWTTVCQVVNSDEP